MINSTEHSFARTWPDTIPRIARVLVPVAAALLLLEYGFPAGGVFLRLAHVLNAFLVVFFVVEQIVPFIRSRAGARDVFRRQRLELLWLAAFTLGLLVGLVLPQDAWLPVIRLFHFAGRGEILSDYLELYLLGVVLIRLVRFPQRMLGRRARPELILAGSFAALIAGGTLLLLLPRAGARADAPITFLDALFTSTSAVCVTGLTVRDTGMEYSLFGQWIIMGLFQVGGLGIMTFVAFVTVFSSHSLPLPQMLAFKHMISARNFAELRRQVAAMIFGTLLVELAGAACLFAFLPGGGDVAARLHWSLFHAISAFCNAGFALQPDSLVGLQAQTGVLVTIMALIVLGGLGFLVMPDLIELQLNRLPLIRNIPWVWRWNARHPVTRVSVQTKLSLVVTAVLLLGGTVTFWLLESNQLLAGRSAGDQFLQSLFQSVTARTAGFNTLPTEKVCDAGIILIIGLMVVGASPVSTGGGIKTVTFGVLLLALRALVTGRARVEAFGRTLPQRVLLAALSVFVIYIFAASAGVFLLSLFDPAMRLEQQAFEVVSALSTVGLSTGITGSLSPASKLVLCALMLVGRIGPITLVLSMFQSAPQSGYEYPDEDLMVG